MEVTVSTLAQFEEEAGRFAQTLEPKEVATLVTLSGELGAGKTAFTKAVARTLGIEDVVNSPTFVLEKIYALKEDQPFKRLVHIDAYRLEAGNELTPLGFSELLKDSGNIIFLEWPEKVADALPKADHAISIRSDAQGTRTILYG